MPIMRSIAIMKENNFLEHNSNVLIQASGNFISQRNTTKALFQYSDISTKTCLSLSNSKEDGFMRSSVLPLLYVM